MEIPEKLPLSEKRKKWKIEAAKDQKAISVYRTGGVGALSHLRQKIAELSGNGDAIVEFLFRAMTGQESDINGRDRLEAAKELGNRYWGKAIDVVAVGQLSKEQSESALNLSPEDLVSSIRKLKAELQDADVVKEDE